MAGYSGCAGKPVPYGEFKHAMGEAQVKRWKLENKLFLARLYTWLAIMVAIGFATLYLFF